MFKIVTPDVFGEQASADDADFGERLADAYEDGESWDKHKAISQSRELQHALRSALGMRYAQEVSHCSVELVLKRDADGDLSVRPFETCKRRWCPVCAWRKSLAQWGKMQDRLPDLIAAHGPVRWLLLTLTVRNCAIEDLRATVKRILGGFRTLTNSKSKLGRLWPATGWLRALEITFPRPGEAHPHLHVLMAVKPSYFSHGYVPHAEWVRRWRQACKLDYDPVVDIRRVKPLSPAVAQSLGDPLAEALGGLREVSKYIVKPADMVTADAARGLMLLKSVRFVDGGGWLRGILRDLPPDDEGGGEGDEEAVGVYWWRAAQRVYRRHQPQR